MILFRAAVPFLFLSLSAAGAVSLLQMETFDGPTGWTSGNVNPNPPLILPHTGPGGFNDSALLVSSSAGNSAGSRLVTFNTTDWSGDYSGQGVTNLRMDLRNTGSGDLFIRIAVNGPGGWFVTDGQSLDAGLGYASFLFDLRPVALTPAQDRSSPPGSDVDATLAAVTQIRILHNTADASAVGAVGNATLRVDNITAIPEPRIPMIAGLALFFWRNRKR